MGDYQIRMMFLQPRINFKGKTCGVIKEFFRFGVTDDIGVLVKRIVPFSATGIEINGLFGECRVSRFQGQESIVMPAPVAFDPVSAGANNDVGQDSGGVIGVTKAPVIGQFSDLRVGEIAVDDRPQVLNLGAAGWLRHHAIFGQ